MQRPVMSCPGLYDPTTIMNADELNRAQKEGWIKLGFYLISFFYYLYRWAEGLYLFSSFPLAIQFSIISQLKYSFPSYSWATVV